MHLNHPEPFTTFEGKPRQESLRRLGCFAILRSPDPCEGWGLSMTVG